jgi:hypothetical protein
MRVWIQQEISNAADLVIQCRNVILPISNVYYFLRLASSKVSSGDINTPTWIDWVDIYPNIHLPSRFGFLDSHHRPLQGSTLSTTDLNLLGVLATSFNLQCTDDRDRLYGILHLANDYSEGVLTISYDYSVKETYTSVAKFVLRKYNSLNFLLYSSQNRRLPDQERALARWVPDWRDPSTRIWIAYWPKFENAVPRLLSLFKQASPMMTPYSMLMECVLIVSIRYLTSPRVLNYTTSRGANKSVSQWSVSCKINTYLLT